MGDTGLSLPLGGGAYEEGHARDRPSGPLTTIRHDMCQLGNYGPTLQRRIRADQLPITPWKAQLPPHSNRSRFTSVLLIFRVTLYRLRLPAEHSGKPFCQFCPTAQFLSAELYLTAHEASFNRRQRFQRL